MRGERGKEDDKRLQNTPLAAFQVVKFIDSYHKGTHCRIEREGLYVSMDLAYQLVQDLEFRRQRLLVRNNKAVFPLIQSPQPFQEPVNPVNSLGVPWL